MITNKLKVFLKQDIIPIYREPIFKRLSKLPGWDLTVFYYDLTKNDIKNSFKQSDKFNDFKTIKFNNKSKFQFLRYVIKNKPDIIIGSFDFIEFYLLRFFSVILNFKIILWWGGVSYTDDTKNLNLFFQGRISKYFKFFSPKKRLFKLYDAYLVYSDYAKYFIENLLNIKKPVFVAYNSPDTNFLLKTEQEILNNKVKLNNLKNKYAPNNEKIILLVGRLNKARRIDLLLNAYLKVVEKTNAALIIIGDGEERVFAQNFTKQHKLKKVFFTGAIYNDYILSQYYMISDVYVTTGVASLTIQYAMTFGKPIISMAQGNEIHIIKNNENGFVVPFGDIDMFSDKIIKILFDDLLREKFGKKSGEIIKNKYNIDNMIIGFKSAVDNFAFNRTTIN